MCCTGGQQDSAAGRARGAEAIDDNPNLFQLFARNPQRIYQCCQEDDGRAMLVVMHHRNIE